MSYKISKNNATIKIEDYILLYAFFIVHTILFNIFIMDVFPTLVLWQLGIKSELSKRSFLIIF